MKIQSLCHWVLRTALGALLLANSASAHPGHPGHDLTPAAASLPDTGHLLPAIVVTALALFFNRGIFRRIP